METEPTPLGGIANFALLQGKRYYVSKKGALWDTAVPPPSACNHCGATHWFWQCPDQGAE